MTREPAETNGPESNWRAVQERTLAATETPSALSLVDLAADATRPSKVPTADRLSKFRRATRAADALEAWFGSGYRTMDREHILQRLSEAVAYIDQLLCDQINAILHHHDFQRLEAAWRGLAYLTEVQADYGDSGIRIRALNTSWKEIERDFERATEFDQSELFRKVYEHEFGSPGGEPYGVLLADYELHPGPSKEHPHNDIAIAKGLARVGAASFCPVILNASPSLLELGNWGELQQTINHRRTHEQLQYQDWHRFRKQEDARFLGLALPHVLLRRPYEEDGGRGESFRFREDVTGRDNSKYLWGGAAFAVGEVLMRSFSQSGWLADIRGMHRNEDRGGLVTHLPIHELPTDREGVAPNFSTDVVITEELEKELSDLGLLPLCHCKDTDYLVFYSSQSAQIPKKYDEPVASTNAMISSMLQYIFCVSRFAHYVKVIGRDKIGSFAEAKELEQVLQRWIVKYVTADSAASKESKARHPLRDAQIRVYQIPGRPGSYHCTMHLAPHYELDELNATIKLTAELNPGQTSR